jgi:hypothetical protein
MIKAKLIKLESISDLPEDKIFVKESEVNEGGFYNWPIVGNSFMFIRPNGESFSKRLPIHTSTVEEILDGRTFKTKNSIYKIVTQEDERDEKIKIIIS